MIDVRAYRKKPVSVSAVRVTFANVVDVAEWCNGRLRYSETGTPHVEVESLEGTMRADLGDWVIRGVAGEFYPCKDAIFRETYEVDE